MPKNEKPRLYFTCALSGLPVEHRQKMVAFRDSLSDKFEILEFCDPKELIPEDIYRVDIHHNVARANIMLAVVDHPGIGLGYEMGVMLEKYGKPLLAVAHADSLVSPFVLGITHSSYRLMRYAELAEVRSAFLDFAAWNDLL